MRDEGNILAPSLQPGELLDNSWHLKTLKSRFILYCSLAPIESGYPCLRPFYAKYLELGL
jgi:hypothetical protein